LRLNGNKNHFVDKLKYLLSHCSVQKFTISSYKKSDCTEF
jgi:hypothetical protein